MNKKDLKNRINETFLELAPDVFDQVMEAPLTVSIMEENVQDKRTFGMVRRFQRMAVAFACLCLVCFGYFGIQMANDDTVYVVLDVNPSICIEVNEATEIESVQGLNDDGKAFVKKLEWKRYAKLEEVEMQIVDQLCEDGVLTDDDMMLVTITQSDDEKYEKLRKRVETGFLAAFENRQLYNTKVAFLQTDRDNRQSGRKLLEKRLKEDASLSDEVCKDMSIKELVGACNTHFEEKIVTNQAEEKNEKKDDILSTTESATQKTTQLTTQEKQATTAERLEEQTTQYKENLTEEKKKKEKKNKGPNENSTKEKKNKGPNENSTKEKKNKKANENSTKEKTTQKVKGNSSKEKKVEKGNSSKKE